eukprot:1597119-Lingulodinium_polyedra.AAC.1
MGPREQTAGLGHVGGTPTPGGNAATGATRARVVNRRAPLGAPIATEQRHRGSEKTQPIPGGRLYT